MGCLIMNSSDEFYLELNVKEHPPFRWGGYTEKLSTELHRIVRLYIDEYYERDV